MNFQNIPPVRKVEEILDTAIRKGKAEAGTIRKASFIEDSLKYAKTVEIQRISAVQKYLETVLENIIHSFPSVYQLPVFYQELIGCKAGIGELKQSLGAVQWAQTQARTLSKRTIGKIKRSRVIKEIFRDKKEYYGRVSSVLKQVSIAVQFLEEARREMKRFPDIDTGLFSVALAGFPNVGKSTLLNALTSSEVEVASYPFTTTRILVGNITEDYHSIQVLDTPGTLNRFEKMNDVEQQAYLAIKHVAHLIVYIFDLTEGYALEDQKKLYRQIQKHNKPVVVYLSKTDLTDQMDSSLAAAFAQEMHGFTDVRLLKQEIMVQYFLWLKGHTTAKASEKPPSHVQVSPAHVPSQVLKEDKKQ
ncbi:hypothetical protein COY95_03390 [Candidatus Woesearchaeota archaeon CG_4_10_14_0_8_um_filter_47_5]|nr:MAG: hypothetical protein COY95_03390 [Candidatus Woesearchaeota archaeon CG_4_10_14_0_8_um_filter_47_5]